MMIKLYCMSSTVCNLLEFTLNVYRINVIEYHLHG